MRCDSAERKGKKGTSGAQELTRVQATTASGPTEMTCEAPCGEKQRLVTTRPCRETGRPALAFPALHATAATAPAPSTLRPSAAVQCESPVLPAAQEHILAQEDGKARLLRSVTELSQAFALAVPHDAALEIRDDVGFFQAVRSVLAKGTSTLRLMPRAQVEAWMEFQQTALGPPASTLFVGLVRTPPEKRDAAVKATTTNTTGFGIIIHSVVRRVDF